MSETNLPILMYHGLHVDERCRGRFDPTYSVTPDRFAAQLDRLRQNGYRSVRLCELATDADDGKRVVITFDDGDVSNLEVALPLLRERGMLAEFFVTSGFVDQPGMLTSRDVRALADAGMGVQSHGATHRYLQDLDDAELESELVRSKQALEQMTGVGVDALALPGGRGGARECAAALRLGYRHVLNSEPGLNRRRREGEYLQRLSVTRALALDDFADRVAGRGIGPYVAQWRYRVLALPKRLLGNARYERLRKRVLGQ
ncbi:MAG: polysaccharide deacetylase family protein [Rudaea sp.]|uniref:polysaccharide deacetylase family protein n=1 Tax=Rudaea sp. TaxID=2136325 RepID=UPI0039E3DF68